MNTKAFAKEHKDKTDDAVKSASGTKAKTIARAKAQHAALVAGFEAEKSGCDEAIALAHEMLKDTLAGIESDFAS